MKFSICTKGRLTFSGLEKRERDWKCAWWLDKEGEN